MGDRKDNQFERLYEDCQRTSEQNNCWESGVGGT